ncbi:hypothetical protein GCM10009797_33470 [Nocardioides hwasunensis]
MTMPRHITGPPPSSSTVVTVRTGPSAGSTAVGEDAGLAGPALLSAPPQPVAPAAISSPSTIPRFIPEASTHRRRRATVVAGS